MEFKELLPFATLILGWGLSESSTWLKSRQNKKTALANALSELLEIHHSLVGERLVKAEILKYTEIQIEQEPHIREMLNIMHIGLDEVAQRYNDAVAKISGYEPLLAFQLRNKEKITPIILKLRDLSHGDKDSEQFINKAIDELQEKLIPVIEEAVLDVARKHNWLTWYKARKIVKNKGLPMDLHDLMKDVFDINLIKKLSTGE